jgi:hypothetical protein
MRRFLIRAVQVFALPIIGTGLLVDTSFAAMVDKATCDGLGGEWIVDTMSYGASINNPKITCIYHPSGGGTTYINCYNDRCRLDEYDKEGHHFITYAPGYKNPPRRPGTTTMTAGTCADRGFCGRRAPTLGAPVISTLNGVAPSHTAPASSTGAALSSGLKAGAPSQTAPTVSTGAALNTQGSTGLTGIDKSVAIPSQLSDHLSRMRR